MPISESVRHHATLRHAADDGSAATIRTTTTTSVTVICLMTYCVSVSHSIQTDHSFFDIIKAPIVGPRRSRVIYSSVIESHSSVTECRNVAVPGKWPFVAVKFPGAAVRIRIQFDTRLGRTVSQCKVISPKPYAWLKSVTDLNRRIRY